MKQKTELLCKDCKHSFRSIANILTHGLTSEYAYQCRKSFKETHVEPNPVVGSKKVQAKYDSCGIARIGQQDREDRCGEAGKWWEPKNKKHLFLLIKKEAY
jgi:hypothetical protein